MHQIAGNILYVLIFIAIYVQVFFLFTFLKNKKHMSVVEKLPIKRYPSIGILVSCWNEEKSISKTILSLLDLDYPKDKLFIYVIDDGSTDDTFNIAKEFLKFSQVQVLKKENGGKHSALNFALERANTELVCSIDADTIIKKDALLEVVRFFEKKRDLSAVGCTVLIENPKTMVQKAQSIEYQMFSFSKKMLGIMDAILVAPGAFSVFKTDVLKKIGGWTQGHSLEDLELTFRLHRNGYKSNHCHTAIAYTKSPSTLKKLFRQRLRWGYGFLKNTHDYKEFVFDSKLGDFGLFTIPMSIFSYISLVFIFSYSWYRMGYFIYDKIVALNIIGWRHLFGGNISINWFYINTQTISVLSLLLVLSIIVTIFLGRNISGVKGKLHHIGFYFLIYSFFQPLWVIRSIYNYLFVKAIAWR